MLLFASIILQSSLFVLRIDSLYDSNTCLQRFEQIVYRQTILLTSTFTTITIDLLSHNLHLQSRSPQQSSFVTADHKKARLGEESGLYDVMLDNYSAI